MNEAELTKLIHEIADTKSVVPTDRASIGARLQQEQLISTATRAAPLVQEFLIVKYTAQVVPIGLAILTAAAVVAPSVQATVPDAADSSIQQFLAQNDAQPAYRAHRRLEATSGDKHGWLEAATEYSPEAGFDYHVTAEGGSGVIRGKVLRAVLQREREVISQGNTARSSLARANYTFQPNGVDDTGLANVLLSPRRKEPELVAGTMFLQPSGGNLVRLEGRLAKSPSFWVKNVDIVRKYEEILGVVVPVALESTAEVRMLGGAGTLRMTYTYWEIDGRDVRSAVTKQ